MFRMYASNSHSYNHLILALGIVRKPTVWVFITSEYPGIHDMACIVTSVLAAQSAPECRAGGAESGCGESAFELL